MNGIEVVAFGTLWLVVIGLGVLILLLYRQLERAYQSPGSATAGGLPAGTTAPDVEVLTADGRSRPLRYPEDDRPFILAFLTTSCDACETMVDLLEDPALFPGTVIALVSGETTDKIGPRGGRVSHLWLAHPPDAVDGFALTGTPTLYVLQRRTVLASGSPIDRRGVEQLLAEAAGRAAPPSAAANGAAASAPVAVRADGR